MKFRKSVLITIALSLSASANAALVERLGGLAYYDDVADLTWLADANYAQTSGYDADGMMTWADANTWVSGLSVEGISGWRLPSADESCPDFYCTGSEMGNLFYNVLGNAAAGGLSNAGPFSNIQLSEYYWNAELSTDPGRAFDFGMVNGEQFTTNIYFEGDYSWAVQSGDISAVPVPAAVWLFGSGFIGLVGFARRKKA